MYPNGRYLTATAGRKFGPGAGLEVVGRNLGDRMAKGLGAFSATASAPDGYGIQALVPPRKPGSMSALGPMTVLTGAASLLQGAPMVGNGSITLTPADASMSLVVSLAGTGAFSLAGAGSLAGVVQLSGTSSMTLTGTAGLSMIVPFEGAGSFSLTGAADLRGRLSMQGEWTPFSTLSPEGLASAVWGANAATFNEAGTMGSKVNTASSGGVDLNALASAVWAHTVRGLTGPQEVRVGEIWQRLGLDSAAPLTTTTTSITAGAVTQSVSEAGGAVTVQRQ